MRLAPYFIPNVLTYKIQFFVIDTLLSSIKCYLFQLYPEQNIEPAIEFLL